MNSYLTEIRSMSFIMVSHILITALDFLNEGNKSGIIEVNPIKYAVLSQDVGRGGQ